MSSRSTSSNGRKAAKSAASQAAHTEPQPTVKQRVEMSWPETAREVADLAQLASKTHNNPTRRGEAARDLVNLWSRVLHGELSPITFWEFFGVKVDVPPPSPQMGYPAVYPQMYMVPPTPPGMIDPNQHLAGVMPEPELDPKTKARKERISRNREAASDVWSS